ncbi:hypothetical protein [Vibrio campbellii]|uniref:Uncharacterized protein n=1 Tax=Vibrio campbellii (strain ATCC BAA-1116) TaxID=2902295 RepID=A7MZ52_VIBC1|nr:hypothetical protein [Vibrio campbellii]ABU69164.1 hypothetical protein VIBHAR_00116 [Vibrio campbellii ATCC BAA-1116]AGU96730.1 hypothetical protein M892_12030 [Vibrio campbellii ATCC BAA-1116]MBT0122091.1 hypothetical protein [Vibrio campbellii]MBT0137194.1 hypothetical protein [Vibrio campbellii]MBT0141870.1 hypothetical protein [Vibrio campbellii]
MRLTKVGLAVLTALLASGCSDDDSTSSLQPLNLTSPFKVLQPMPLSLMH